MESYWRMLAEERHDLICIFRRSVWVECSGGGGECWWQDWKQGDQSGGHCNGPGASWWSPGLWTMEMEKIVRCWRYFEQFLFIHFFPNQPRTFVRADGLSDLWILQPYAVSLIGTQCLVPLHREYDKRKWQWDWNFSLGQKFWVFFLVTLMYLSPFPSLSLVSSKRI